MSVRLSSATLRYLVIGPVDTGDVDPTELTVWVAFVANDATPADDDWVEADWETISGAFYVRSLVAGEAVETPPGDATVLDIGTYVVWVRIEDTPEIPAQPVNAVIIYGSEAA